YLLNQIAILFKYTAANGLGIVIIRKKYQLSSTQVIQELMLPTNIDDYFGFNKHSDKNIINSFRELFEEIKESSKYSRILKKYSYYKSGEFKSDTR
ncbi:hypothetical protein, partial [Spartinivicinus poritis]